MLARVLFAPDAPLSDKLLGVAIIAVFAGLFFLLGWVILKLLRFSKRVAGGVADDVAINSIDPANQHIGQHEVVFTFTTYTGFGVWVVQSTRRYALPYDAAKEVLRKLLRHNCTWGLLGPFLIFVPFLSLAEYSKRLKEIDRQRQGFEPVMKSDQQARALDDQDLKK